MVFRTLVPRRSGHKLTAATAATAALASSAIVVGVLLASGPASAVAATSPPATVTATLIAPSPAPTFLQPGHAVSSSVLGVRVFVNGKDGVALNTGLSLKGVTYPVATVNGGKTWRIDGPELHVPAANGPDVVTQVGAGGSATYFAYGGPAGANPVDVSADAGKYWYRAYLEGQVSAVVYSYGTLFAFTNAPDPYVSSDGGKVWRYDKTFF